MQNRQILEVYELNVMKLKDEVKNVNTHLGVQSIISLNIFYSSAIFLKVFTTFLQISLKKKKKTLKIFGCGKL